ncbi:MAG: hypothetical protein WCK47_12795 [bacterium]|nr:hypothetical protein [Candidatus Sumerlaeota bacterium]
MNTDKDDGRSLPPGLKTAREEIKRLKFLWALCCLTPLLYMLIARAIDDSWFQPAARHGFVAMRGSTYIVVSGVFACAAGFLQILIFIVKRNYAAEIRKPALKPTEIMQILKKRTIILAAISESAILLGFILFLLRGDLAAMFAFGVLAFVYYAQSYPCGAPDGAL